MVYRLFNFIIMAQHTFFRTPYNYDDKDNVYEINSLPSETVPDQSYSIRELLARFTQGTMPPVGMPVAYDSDTASFNDATVDLEDVYSSPIDITEVYARVDSLSASKASKLASMEALREKNKRKASPKSDITPPVVIDNSDAEVE